MPLKVRKWIYQCGSILDRDINAAINININIKYFAIDDAHSFSVKSPPVAILINLGAIAKGIENSLRDSEEAPH